MAGRQAMVAGWLGCQGVAAGGEFGGGGWRMLFYLYLLLENEYVLFNVRPYNICFCISYMCNLIGNEITIFSA